MTIITGSGDGLHLFIKRNGGILTFYFFSNFFLSNDTFFATGITMEQIKIQPAPFPYFKLGPALVAPG
jgi:hypothetical protein